MSQNSRGVLIFANNNSEIDYFRIALVNSLLIQKNLGLTADQVTIVTDSNTLEYAKTYTEEKFFKSIGNIIIVEKDLDFKLSNKRVYKDTSQHTATLSFYNRDRCDAYDLSPYDETILLDADYLVLSDALNACWGHNNELMMNNKYHDVNFKRTFNDLDKLSNTGIDMYWATVVYFRKSAMCESFFNITKHVRDHREYYGNLYQWNGNVYRNDYSFSIAAHMIGGFTSGRIPSLPVKLYKTFDNDDIYDVGNHWEGEKHSLDILLYLEKIRSPGDFIITRWRGVDIHIMNKWAINRVADKILGTLEFYDVA